MSRITDTHPELFHYTTAEGLSGILRSRSLWATHSNYVNDEEEILGFYERILPTLLRPIFQKYMQRIKANPEFQQELGGRSFEHYCDEQFIQLINTIRTTAAQVHDHYITSFSVPSDEWTRSNGLLSQWRAYGPNGGYAIVFDTSNFDEMLAVETAPYQEEIFSWADVNYHLNESGLTNDADTNKLINELNAAAEKFFGDPSEESTRSLTHPLTVLSSIFKHRGFEEENEVRFVLTLLGPLLEAEPELQLVRQHPINTRLRNGEVIPFVELCVREEKGVRLHLPIKRIIVGPHRDKHDRKRGVQLLLKQHGLDPDIVTVSDIPYRG